MIHNCLRLNSRKPLVSAIVSTFKSERFLRGCLESLRDQTIFDHLEVIVIVSGSPENEIGIAIEFQRNFQNLVILETSEREGLYTAWNRAVRLARGEFLTNANTDDRLHHQALEHLSAVLKAYPEYALVYPDCLITDRENETFRSTSATLKLETQDYCLFDALRYPFIGPCPMWRRSVHDSVGFFDERATAASDYDFWLRVAEKFPLIHLRETLGLYLDNPTSLAHEKVCHDETVHLLYERRRSVPISTVFPSLNNSSDPVAKGFAYASMADICMMGPWPADLPLAKDFLAQAKDNHAPELMVQNNLAAIEALQGNTVRAFEIWRQLPSSPLPQKNLQWLTARLKNQNIPGPYFIPARHEVVLKALQTYGLDPEDVPPLQNTESLSKRRSFSKQSLSVLLFQNEHPLDPEGINSGAEMALIHLGRNLVTTGCKVTIAGRLNGKEGTASGILFRDTGNDYNYQSLLSEVAPECDVLIASNRGDVALYAKRYRNLQCRILWTHSNVVWATHLSAPKLNLCADGIVCVSEFQRQAYKNQGVDIEKMHVIRNGTDSNLFKPESVDRDLFRICYAGALVPLKGVHVLLKAFETVRKTFPQSLLDIYGSADLWGEPEYINDAKNNPNETGVYFHGKVSQSELVQAFSRSSLLVLPSLITCGDCFPLTALDAQSCECPVLGTPSGGIPEAIEDGITGRIISDDHPQTMATAIIELLQQPKKLKAMGRSARQRIIADYTWQHTAEKFLDLFENLQPRATDYSSIQQSCVQNIS